MKRFFLSAVVMSAMALPGVFAQDEPKVQTRREEQQKRIGEGVANGSLTPKETVKLEKQQRAINHEIRDGREDHGGKLTAAEKKRINRQQNKTSKKIYAEKHDGAKQ